MEEPQGQMAAVIGAINAELATAAGHSGHLVVTSPGSSSPGMSTGANNTSPSYIYSSSSSSSPSSSSSIIRHSSSSGAPVAIAPGSKSRVE